MTNSKSEPKNPSPLKGNILEFQDCLEKKKKLIEHDISWSSKCKQS